ncbi:MAG: hypothetical protein LBQ88_12765 [Treponema sp.]|jgi:hypothetical protein|nr:hypothetical protein [Treponema sp.]
MAISEKSIGNLEKLYEKRKALDKQILEAEKKLLAEAKTEAKGKAAPGKPAARKPRSPKASA